MHGSSSKVPELTLLFWALETRDAALGETGGDAEFMSLNLG
jgi:uncharacterized membrane-anchored protein